MLYQLSYWIVLQKWGLGGEIGRDGWNRTSDAGVKVPCLDRLATPLYKKRWAGADERPGPVYGVGDGTRTHDTRNHNPMLYQLNYAHHIHFFHFTRGGFLRPQDGRRPNWGLRPTRLAGLARLEGLEPPAHCLEGSCSIHLSYRRIWSG